MFRLLLASLLLIPVGATAQNIAGVRLGITTLREVRLIRGVPEAEGLTEDGRSIYQKYGPWVFYFTRDSVAQFARFFPVGMTRSQLEAIFGTAKREQRHLNLTIGITLSDTVAASLDRDGRHVSYVEYMPRGQAGGTWDALTHMLNGHLTRLYTLVWFECNRLYDAVDAPRARAVYERHLTAGLDSTAGIMLGDSLRVHGSRLCVHVRSTLGW